MSRFVVALAVAALSFLASPDVASAGRFETLYKFHGSDGTEPTYRLTRDAAGNLYGATRYGGSFGDGTVFKLAPDGTQTVLHSFQFSDGIRRPMGGVVQDAGGNLYGVTELGGVVDGSCRNGRGDWLDCGAIYKLAPDGTLTVLHAFTGADGGLPLGELTFDRHGNLYGSTNAGGNYLECTWSGCGTVFKLAPDGTLTTLYAFKSLRDGAFPTGTVVFDRHGNLYGTTTGGGMGNGFDDYGTIFKIAPDGTETILHAFLGSDGGVARSLAIDAYGNLFGTALTGGIGNGGVVFKLATADGSYSLLHTFTTADGLGPSPLLVDKRGDLYGETFDYGPRRCRHGGCGTVFKVAADGTFTTVHAFQLTGYNPMGGLVQDSRGQLYGVASNGGNSNNGDVFRVRK